MTIKAPKHSVIVLAMGWLRYLNEIEKENKRLFLPDTALELQALWYLGEVIHANCPDSLAQEAMAPQSHILFLAAGSCPLSGQKQGNPGVYVVHTHFVAGVFENDFISPTLTEVYQKITDSQGLQSKAASYADGPSLHRSESSPASESSILITPTTIAGVF